MYMYTNENVKSFFGFYSSVLKSCDQRPFIMHSWLYHSIVLRLCSDYPFDFEKTWFKIILECWQWSVAVKVYLRLYNLYCKSLLYRLYEIIWQGCSFSLSINKPIAEIGASAAACIDNIIDVIRWLLHSIWAVIICNTHVLNILYY